MDISTPLTQAKQLSGRLPAQRIDANGVAHVDLRAVMALALPLVANSAVQVVLNLTDMWFIGHISTRSLAAVGAVHWLVLMTLLVFSGVGMAVQTIAAQAFGARRYARASQALWNAMWGALLGAPLLLAVAASGHSILSPFGLAPDIEHTAVEFWAPRVAGASFGAAMWAVIGFFNGIGNSKLSLIFTATVGIANAICNYVFIFRFGWGVAGSAWATNVAQLIGLGVALGVFLSAPYRQQYRTHLTWKPSLRVLLRQLRIGFPMGIVPAADLLGFAIFQIMQTRLGAADGAASQTVTMICTAAYMTGAGVAFAGTTLVGQSIGAGDRAWAARLGNYVITLVACLMGGIGLVLAAIGPWVLPVFLSTEDPDAARVIALSVKLLWIATLYQFFDGLSLASSLCLRGAGDAVVPAILVLTVSWLVFVPVAHILTFAPGQGWFELLPQLGWGAVGGWIALVLYLMVLGLVMLGRWRSGAWRRISI